MRCRLGSLSGSGEAPAIAIVAPFLLTRRRSGGRGADQLGPALDPFHTHFEAIQAAIDALQALLNPRHADLKVADIVLQAIQLGMDARELHPEIVEHVAFEGIAHGGLGVAAPNLRRPPTISESTGAPFLRQGRAWAGYDEGEVRRLKRENENR
jgi:hypothetical protein